MSSKLQMENVVAVFLELVHIDKILTSVAICFCESAKAVNFSAAATECSVILWGGGLG